IITNCILWGNTPSQVSETATVMYSCVQGGFSGDGNISDDPAFVDAMSGNLRLQSGSPCCDTGNNASVPAGVTTDLDGHPRILNGIVDMGAYEFIPFDFDLDGDVDLADFSFFQVCFNGPNRPPTAACAADADFDDDGDVDLSDFSIFAQCFNGPNRAPRCP
ncbi:MAG: hypothetical protein JXA69_12145, partial [Phycisphaerae bacterium]|nr:hypothetical protein [Phycisphaerae bacterium]